MKTRRHGEGDTVHFRSGRVFCVDNDWYYSTREGKDIGPFSTKAEAEVALALFLKEFSPADEKDAGAADIG